MFLVDWVRLARSREWCQSKLPFITAAILLLMAPGLSSWAVVHLMATIALWAAFGYGLNDLTDRSGDERSGKPNRASISPASWTLFLLLSAGGAFGLCLLWASDAAAPAVLLAGLALTVAYSVPPLRLKERGAWGLTAAAAAQWSLPILALSAAEPRGWLRPAAWALALLGFAIGVRWIAVHQMLDAAADRVAQVRTFASTGGRLEPVIFGAFLSEIALLAAALALTWPRSLPALVALATWMLWRSLFRSPPDPLQARLRTYRHAPLAEFYFLMLPVALASSRELSSPAFFGVGPLLLLLGAPHIVRMIREWRVSRMFSGSGV